VTAAEAPNGAVFVSPQDPLSTSTTVVSVIDGNGPAQVAETMPSGVAALAADNINLYVGSYANVTAFNRSTGNKIGTWPLQEINTANSSDADLVTMSASGGHVFVMESQGNIERVYRFSPGSKAFPQLIAKGTSAAFGPNGSIYYARSDGHLVERTNSGATIVGPLLANAPNGEGGGVQYVTAVANGLVWVSEPAGQGLDTQFSRYDATTLKLLNSNSGTVSESIVGTSLGALVLSPPAGAGNCPQTTSTSSDSCVYQAASDGTLTNSTSVGMAITLLGPQAVVIGNGPTPTAFEMQRISSTS